MNTHSKSILKHLLKSNVSAETISFAFYSTACYFLVFLFLKLSLKSSCKIDATGKYTIFI